MSTRSFRGARLVRFGAFELDLRAAELRKYGVRIRLQEQPFRILVMLLERPGEIVLREEIRKRLWPNDTVVEVGHGINAAVLRLREALGESAENPRYVETLARRGYRFMGEVEVVLKDEIPRPASVPPTVPALDTGGLEGRTLSHFTVLEKLGGGGMGVVYRAQDLKLGREVALKFLPGELVGDAAAVSRFQREARAASALNHPNVCTIYGVEDCDGQPVIVMEMIEGQTLAERLESGPLPVDETLRLSIQVASALDAAHRKGIVHRDLKPGNLLVAGSVVKVLDFGLAKISRPGAMQNAPGKAVPVGTSLTQFGAVMGTLHYMSPEQVQGRETDARSDIYSFGLVLYEMLTGLRAVQDENSQSVVRLLERFAPEAIERVVRRCLERDPEERWQSARDLKAALEWIFHAPPQPAPLPTPAAAPPRPWSRLAIAPIAILAVVALVWLRPGKTPDRPRMAAVPIQNAAMTVEPPAAMPKTVSAPPTSPALVRIPLPIAEGLNPVRFALSPDARSLAFVAGNSLYVQSLATGVVRPVTSSAVGTPFWSPDSQSLAFASGRQLKRVPATGGEAVTICDVNTNIAGSWGTDGTILIGMVGDGIYRVPANGGVPERISDLDHLREETRHLLPQFLTGGGRYLYIAGSPKPEKNALFSAALGSRDRAVIMPAGSNVSFVPARPGSPRGYLVFMRERLLMAQRFDLGSLHLTGEPQLLAGGITTNATVGASVQTADFTVAGDTLIYRASSEAGRGAMAMKGHLTLLKNWMEAIK